MSSTHPTIDPAATLAAIALAEPAASRVFQRLHIDFCCQGRRTLSDVCRDRGIDAAEVVATIEHARGDVASRFDVARASVPELIDHVVGHYHARIREELPALLAMAQKVERRHADKTTVPRGLAAHLAEVAESLATHLDKEERVLFPLLRAGMSGPAQGPVRVIEAEHDDHAAALARTRALTADLVLPPEACATWRALYQRLEAFELELFEHVHLENHVLFPRALAH